MNERPPKLSSRRTFWLLAGGVVSGSVAESFVISLLRHKDFSGVLGALAGSLVAMTILYFGMRD